MYYGKSQTERKPQTSKTKNERPKGTLIPDCAATAAPDRRRWTLSCCHYAYDTKMKDRTHFRPKMVEKNLGIREGFDKIKQVLNHFFNSDFLGVFLVFFPRFSVFSVIYDTIFRFFQWNTCP